MTNADPQELINRLLATQGQPVVCLVCRTKTANRRTCPKCGMPVNVEPIPKTHLKQQMAGGLCAGTGCDLDESEIAETDEVDEVLEDREHTYAMVWCRKHGDYEWSWIWLPRRRL